jgi:SAM-dependent methyltransferase
MARFDAAQVRRYYDQQTRAFVAYGQGGGEGAIHRAVWGPGVTARDQSFHFVEDRILEWLPAVGATPHVVDLGCGVGGSLCYLADRHPMRGTGVTLSPVQAQLATERIHARGLADHVTCIEGDYTQLPPGIDTADLAFAIESFVHGPSPERFFAEARRLIRPGGLLVVCDDLRRETTGPKAARALDRFARGWHINSLLTRDTLYRLAHDAGFVHEETTDLTPWLELGRPRDRVVAALVALVGWLPLEDSRFGMLAGGSALQTCLRRGWIGYDLVRFRRGPSSARPPA